MNLEHDFECNCSKCYNEFLPIGEQNITELRAKKLCELAEQEGGLKQFINAELERLPNYGKICTCDSKPVRYDQELEDDDKQQQHQDVCLRCAGRIPESKTSQTTIHTWMHATHQQRIEYIVGNKLLVDHLGEIVRKHGGFSESEIISECANSHNPQYFSPSEFFRILDDLDESDMTIEELLSEKYCVQCKQVVKTYWELESCDKSTKGLLEEESLEPHGNEIQGTPTCEDEYCNPKYTKVAENDISKEYIQKHSVFERCNICHQFLSSQ